MLDMFEPLEFGECDDLFCLNVHIALMACCSVYYVLYHSDVRSGGAGEALSS